MSCTQIDQSATMLPTPFDGCKPADPPSHERNGTGDLAVTAKKNPSGFQRRKARVARGLPRYTPAELASRKARGRVKSRAKNEQRNRENAAFISALKVQTGCTDCGYNRHPDALDFDHLPGVVKRSGISYLMRRSRQAILDEIAKCEVVCANCHRIRTWQRKVDAGVLTAAQRWTPTEGPFSFRGTPASGGRTR